MRDLKPALASYQRFLAMSHGEIPNQEFQARQRIKTAGKGDQQEVIFRIADLSGVRGYWQP